MARVSTYLNFPGHTEEAFHFYRSVFQSEFQGPLMRMRDAPGCAEMKLSEAEQNMIMHMELPILGGHVLMGTDALESLGKLSFGNNFSINLEPDTRAEAERLFHALAEGGTITMPLRDMFWGGYFGCLKDRYGVQWMVNCAAPKP